MDLHWIIYGICSCDAVTNFLGNLCKGAEASCLHKKSDGLIPWSPDKTPSEFLILVVNLSVFCIFECYKVIYFFNLCRLLIGLNRNFPIVWDKDFGLEYSVVTII